MENVVTHPKSKKQTFGQWYTKTISNPAKEILLGKGKMGTAFKAATYFVPGVHSGMRLAEMADQHAKGKRNYSPGDYARAVGEEITKEAVGKAASKAVTNRLIGSRAAERVPNISEPLIEYLN
jgi:hypothetical protein